MYLFYLYNYRDVLIKVLININKRMVLIASLNSYLYPNTNAGYIDTAR